MYSLIRPYLFDLEAERAHHMTLNLLRWAGRHNAISKLLHSYFAVQNACLKTTAFGMTFDNLLGLAAGFDKNAAVVPGLALLGFGHVEVGTLTRMPQIGNDKPRLHRIVESKGIINSLGFPNEGVEKGIENLKYGIQQCQHTPAQSQPHIGVNIGKSKDTPIEQAADDYVTLLKKVAPYAGYVTINISSPNTLGLRKLQARDLIESLLREVITQRNALPTPHNRLPVLVKIAPDLTSVELDDVLGAIVSTGANGVIATNTTIGRDGIPAKYHNYRGGLSGQPLRELSTEIIRQIYKRTDGKLPIVGVGGIDSAHAAIEKIRAGASLIQIYTGLIYAGPSLVKQINLGMIKECARLGIKNMNELRNT